MKRVVYCLSFVLISASAYRFFTTKVRPDITVEINSVYSGKIEERLRCFLKNYSEGGVSNYKKFYSKLKTDFKIVKSAEWIVSPGSRVLKIVGVEPNWLVNNKFVLGDKMRLYPVRDFEQYDVNSLKNFTVSKKYCGDKLDESVYKFLQKVPSDLSSRYNINYKDKRHILLKNKAEDKKYIILADEDSIFDSKKLAYVDTIKENVKVFDLRFKDRIVTKSSRKK